jgi:hypothetical protein
MNSRVSSSKSCRSGPQERACGKKRKCPASVARKEPSSRSFGDARPPQNKLVDGMAQDSPTTLLLASGLAVVCGDAASSSCSNLRTRLARSALSGEATFSDGVSVYGEGSSSVIVDCGGERGRTTGVRLAYWQAAAETPRRRHEPQGAASRGQRILRNLHGSQEMGSLRERVADMMWVGRWGESANSRIQRRCRSRLGNFVLQDGDEMR